MAHIHPAGWREVSATGAAQREIETLSILADGLTDAYTVYHGVHWTNVDRGYSVYGEVDFIIVAPSGRVLLIEQKSGFLDETPEGLVKKYQGKDKHVPSQLMRTMHNLMTRFGKYGDALSIDYLLYCPDYLVKRPMMAGIEPSRIVDSNRKHDLLRIIAELLPASDPSTHEHQHKVLRFFADTLELTPDASALVGCATQMVTRLSGGLATWARKLEFSPFRLRIVGTAGSGKTQLALAEYRAAIDSGKKPLYVCYNRPLADHVQRLVPEGGRVATFHMLCDSFLREQGTVPDYRDGAVWNKIEETFAQAAIPTQWMFDAIIIDEGQDFSEQWRDAVLRLLKPDGRAIWLEDPLQNLYGRPMVPPPGWVVLRSATNYRSPRQVVELLGSLGHAVPTDAAFGQIEPASPFLGADIDFLTYRRGDTRDMYDKTKRAITLCLGAGFARGDMALLSYRGRERSALLGLDRLGVHTLKSFTGTYDLFGNPAYRDGELLAESVYRFKGQSAPAVIFTEVDFETLDEQAYRKLFVGLTRARLKLILVLSEEAAQAVLGRL